MSSKEIEDLIKHCEKQILLCSKLNEIKHRQEHETIIEIINNYKQLQQENNELKEKIDNAISTLYVWGEVLRPTFQKEMLEILLEGDK